MKRKLALFLAGCLTISPLSVGIPAVTSYAAEAGSESEFLQLDESSVEVKDENGTVLTAVGDNSTAAQGSYTLTAGETRQLSVFFEQINTHICRSTLRDLTYLLRILRRQQKYSPDRN